MKTYVRVSDILARLQSFKDIDPDILKAKADIGTEVHAAIYQDVHNEHIIMSTQRAEAYFDSYKIWNEKVNPKYTMMEMRLFDDNLMITGQLDALIADENGPILIDYKTSSKANEKIWNMQAHFYWYLLSANKMNVGTRMQWINLRQKKIDCVNDDGEPILDDWGNKLQKYVPLEPKVYEFNFNPKVLQECIDEANKYWDEKADNFDLD